MSKAVVFFAEGTEECEALLVVDLLRRAKVEVTVASASGSREIVSSHKVHITADALAEEVDYSDVDIVVLPGGIPGTPNLAANKTVTDTCVSFAKSGKKVAAICAAPSVLASLGLLEGRKATAHAGFQDKLAGAEVLDTEVVVDGNITTSYGLGGAIPFALDGTKPLSLCCARSRSMRSAYRPFVDIFINVHSILYSYIYHIHYRFSRKSSRHRRKIFLLSQQEIQNIPSRVGVRSVQLRITASCAAYRDKSFVLNIENFGEISARSLKLI